MKGLKGLGLGLVAAVAIVFGLGAGLLASTHVSAQDEAISIGRVTVTPGGQGSVELNALNMSAPGLGAWEINIFYNSAVVTAMACSPQAGSVCNVSFAPNKLRVTGASASGLQGDTTLASIRFRCDSEGASALTLSLDVVADATIGDPQNIDADAVNGSVTCAESGPPLPTRRPAEPTATPVLVVEEEEEPTPTATQAPSANGLPDAGAGGGPGGGSSLGWLVAALAGTGLATMAGYGALHLRARRATTGHTRRT